MSDVIHECYLALYRKLSKTERQMLDILISDGQYRTLGLVYGQLDCYKTYRRNLSESYFEDKLKEYKTNAKHSLSLAIEKLEKLKEAKE